MRGHGNQHILAQNLLAVNTHLSAKQRLNCKAKMCWKCQKDKSIRGGYVKVQAGLYKFICKDCMDAKKPKENT